MNQSKIKKWVIGIFLSVPIISSIISAIHIVNFLNLGNYTILSYGLAIAYELGSISAFLMLGLMEKVNKVMLWTIFFILAFIQILGNIFFSYDFIYNAILEKSTYLNSFIEFSSYFFGNDLLTIKMFLATLIGLPVPILALMFLKSTSEYLVDNKKEEPSSLITSNTSEQVEGSEVVNEEEKYIEEVTQSILQQAKEENNEIVESEAIEEIRLDEPIQPIEPEAVELETIEEIRLDEPREISPVYPVSDIPMSVIKNV